MNIEIPIMFDPWSWKFWLHETWRSIMEMILDNAFAEEDAKRVMPFMPVTSPPMCLSRDQIVQVYYLIEVLYHVGGWLRERPSNRCNGTAQGFSAQSTDVQIHRMFGPNYNFVWQNYLRDLTYNTLTFKQKLLYFHLLKKWGLEK